MNPTPSTARVVALGALAYALLGAAGIALAVGSGYASPVFPAAGAALACALWFGPRALAGISIGSFALNVARAAASGSLDAGALVLALVIAVGATLQAAAGAWLVRRWQGEAARTLEREQDAFKFLLLGGAVAGLISASVAVAALRVARRVEAADVLYTWWTWYVGDVLGIMVVAPLANCFLGSADRLWRERCRRIVAPMAVMLVLEALAFRVAAGLQAEADANRLAHDARTIVDRIEDRLVTHREVLASVRHFAEAIPGFTFPQFADFTRITLRDNPDIFALSFDDVVPERRRHAYEQAMSRLSPLGRFHITELDGDGRPVRAGSRGEYVPVRYIVPLADNEPAVGFDIESDPIRRAAIERARATGGMAVTEPIRLVQEDQPRVGVLELMPVTRAAEDAPPDARPIVGFAVAVAKLDEMIDTATRGYVPAGLTFQLTDRAAAGQRNLVYRSDRRVEAPSPAPPVPAQWVAALQMGDRQWRLSFTAGPAYLRQQRSWLAWGVGVAGLVFATLVQILMLGMTGRTVLAQRSNEALRRAEEELRALADQVQTAREEEQTRIARDLHDELGQLLTALKVMVRGLERKLEDLPPSATTGALVDQVVEADALVDQTVASIHRVVSELRSATLDQLGLTAALQEKARKFRGQARIACEVHAPDELPPLGAKVTTALYRIAQEALTNVTRHAGATRVDIHLRVTDASITLRVEDDGRGIQVASVRDNALGIVGMRERAAQLGGELEVGSGAEGGTVVSARIPLRR